MRPLLLLLVSLFVPLSATAENPGCGGGALPRDRASSGTPMAVDADGRAAARPHRGDLAVFGLSAEARSYSKVNTTWNAVPCAWSYNVYRGTTAEFTPDSSSLAMRTAATVYQDLGLDPCTTYYYRVAAVDKAGAEGQPSAPVAATTTAYSASIHPRLIIFPGDIADIRERCKNHEPWKSWYSVVRQTADRIYDEEPSQEFFNARIDRFVVFSNTFLVEGTDRYFQKLREALLDCPISDEGENELSIGSTLCRFCYAYDIAHPRLTDEERRNVENVIAHWGEWLSARVDQHYSNWRTVAMCGLLPAGLLLDKPLWVEQSVNTMEYTLADQIVGKGSNVEGCGYGGYLLASAGHGMMMLKNAGIRDFYKDPRMMDAVRRRIQERLPWYAGNGYEDSSYYLSHDPFATAMLNSPMPAEATQMKTIFNKTSRACKVGYNRNEPEYLLYCYYTDSVPESPIHFADWADPAAGIGYMGTGMGHEDFVMSFNAKPYAITYANGHQRPDDLSFELAAYGAFLAHEPGYAGYAVPPYADYAHSSEAHSTFTIAGESQDIGVENTGIKSFLFSEALSYIEGVNDNGYSKGKVSRSLVFIKPSAGRRGYVLIGDDVDLDNKDDEFTWFLHGGLSDKLTVNCRDALWTVPRWISADPANNNVKVLAHMASPVSASFEERQLVVDGKDHYEFFSYVGYRTDRQHTKYIAATFTGSQNLLTALYPWKESSSAPDVEDVTGGIRIEENDVAAIQDECANASIDGVAHNAKIMFLRKNGSAADFFFIKDGTDLKYHETGFHSDQAVQLIYDACSSPSEIQLHLLADAADTKVAFFDPRIGSNATVASSDSCTEFDADAGKITVLLSGSGTHRFSILHKGTRPGNSPMPVANPVVAVPSAPMQFGINRHTDLSLDEDYLVPNWHGSSGAEYYVVKQVLNPERTAFKTVATNVHHPSEAFLAVDPTAEFVVSAVNKAGESPNSNPACLTTPVYPGNAEPAADTTQVVSLPNPEVAPSPRPVYGPWHFHRFSNGKDAHVTDGPESDTRHGTEGHLIVRAGKTEGQNARTLIRFDLGNGRVPEPEIERALLKLHCVALESKTNVQLLTVSDDSWRETLVTWATAPTGTLLAERPVDEQNKTYSFDVTEFVQQEFSRDKAVSFMLLATGDGSLVKFGAKEGDRGPTNLPHKRPVLEITGKAAH